MANADSEHFDSYRLQTRVKHAILEGYLPAYFNVIKEQHKNLLFIDGFAGRGYYSANGETFPGSPLRALGIVAANPEFAKRVQCLMIEKHPAYHAELDAEVQKFHQNHPHIKAPMVVAGSFSERVGELLDQLGGGKELAPTFLFVDPCGVDDVSMSSIGKILSQDYCEVFVFFNLDGIRRIAGLAKATGKISPVLVDLYGSPERAAAAVADFQGLASVADREASLVATYRTALRDASGAEFVLPLRVESENKISTSHYLLHATKNALGFKIMKEVMWKAGGAIQCEGDKLALQQASSRGGPALLRPDLDALDSEILAELRGGLRSVGLFRDEWVRRPDDMFSAALYRKRLLALEQAGKIIVLDTDGRTPLPAAKRRPYAGEPSISEKLYVRLPNQAGGTGPQLPRPR